MKQLDIIIVCMITILIAGCDGYQTIKKYGDGDLLYSQYKIDADSLIQGEYIVYYENGETIFEKSNYTDGELDGIRKLYFDNGQVEISENYVDGVLSDTLRVYFKSGVLKQSKYYDAGVLSGVVKTYFEDGTLKEEATFVDNIEQGPFVEYHPNGHPKWRGTFRNGDKEYGELIKYDESGQEIQKLMCDTAAVCKTIWTLEAGYLAI